MKKFSHKTTDGNRVHVSEREQYGFTDGNQIFIDPRQKGLRHLDTLIHELLHVEIPGWPEQTVEVMAKSISTLVWKAGYRRKQK